jgi:hypothetical protein
LDVEPHTVGERYEGENETFYRFIASSNKTSITFGDSTLMRSGTSTTLLDPDFGTLDCSPSRGRPSLGSISV